VGRRGGRRAGRLAWALGGRAAAAAGARAPSLAALLCAFAVTSHGGAPALARLPVAGVAATEAAVLAQRDAIGVVALALVGLVVAMFAVLAGEGHCDSYVSARHVEVPAVVMGLDEEKPRPARGRSSVARPSQARRRGGRRAITVASWHSEHVSSRPRAGDRSTPAAPRGAA